MAAMLVAASAAVAFLLGAAHLYLTYFSKAFEPRESGLAEILKTTTPRITSQTSFANAAVGFHVSHSLGIIIFATLYGYLALVKPVLLFGSGFFSSFGLFILLAYLVLAIKYWFSKPLIGISVSLVLYLSGMMAASI